MKCQQCKAWTEVADVRIRKDGARRRTYLCANMHKFTTLEVIASIPPGGRSAEIPGLSFYRTETVAELKLIEQTVQRLLKTLVQ